MTTTPPLYPSSEALGRTSPRDGFDMYRTIAFIDSNIVLEGKPFENMPWTELDEKGPILVMLLPQVLREIDSKKRDGRLQTYARAFNRLIASAAVSGRPERVRTQTPAVDVCLARCAPINWAAYDDLDPGEGDCRVIAELLSVLGVSPEHRLLVSGDISPIGMASRRGVRTFHATDTWQRQPEPAPAEKEMQRLRSRVAELEAKEPKFEIGFALAVAEADPIDIYQVTPLSDNERASLISNVLERNPMAGQSGILFQPMYDSTLERRYKKYETKIVPAFAESFHSTLELLYGQVPFSLEINNIGKMQAECLVVELETSSGWLHDKLVFVPTSGPRAPKPRNPLDLQHLRHRDLIPARLSVGRHEVVLDPQPCRSRQVVAQCQDFRHGRRWIFEGVMWLDPRANAKVAVTVRVTASNMRGDSAKTFAVEHQIAARHAAELVELETGRRKLKFPMEYVIESAIESRNFDRIDLLGDED